MVVVVVRYLRGVVATVVVMVVGRLAVWAAAMGMVRWHMQRRGAR